MKGSCTRYIRTEQLLHSKAPLDTGKQTRGVKDAKPSWNSEPDKEEEEEGTCQPKLMESGELFAFFKRGCFSTITGIAPDGICCTKFAFLLLLLLA